MSAVHIAEASLKCFQQQVVSSLGAADFEAVDEGGVVATRFRGAAIGPVKVFRYDGRGVRRGRRSLNQIRLHPQDDFIVMFPLHRSIRVTQLANEATVEPGHFTILSTNRPYELQCSDPPYHDYAELVVRVPAPLLRSGRSFVDHSTAVALTASQGSGRVAYTLIETIFNESGKFQEKEAQRLGEIVIDSIGLAMTADGSIINAQDRLSRIHERARAYIDSHLSDPQLHTREIARHCRVSERQLYIAFSAGGETVAGYIREKRLLCCQSDLVSGGGRGIFTIAQRWGYSNPAGFARAYRARFGCSPREARAHSPEVSRGS